MSVRRDFNNFESLHVANVYPETLFTNNSNINAYHRFRRNKPSLIPKVFTIVIYSMCAYICIFHSYHTPLVGITRCKAHMEWNILMPIGSEDTI